MNTQYACIVADPPWLVKAGPARAPYCLGANGVQAWDKVSRPSRDLPYESMSVDEVESDVSLG
jgi:hypothetical protein